MRASPLGVLFAVHDGAERGFCIVGFADLKNPSPAVFSDGSPDRAYELGVLERGDGH